MRLWLEDQGLPAFAAEVPPFHPIVAVARAAGGGRWEPVATILVAIALAAIAWAILRPRDRRTRIAGAGASALAAVALPLPVAIFLLTLGSSASALVWLARDPTRARWAAVLAVLSAGIVGTTGAL